jgi:hypothetical protein
MFRFATTFLLTTLLAVNAMEISTEGSVPLDSAMGQALLRKATVIEPARHLNQNNQNQGNAAYLGKYEIKYLGCNSLIQLNREAGNNQNEGILYTQHLVRFALCPANSCNSCNGGGEYAVNMAEFVDAYTEAKLSEEAYACEMARENCVCDNADDAEACESACYSNAGLTNCAQAEGEAEFQIQRYLECRGKLMHHVPPQTASPNINVGMSHFDFSLFNSRNRGRKQQQRQQRERKPVLQRKQQRSILRKPLRWSLLR